MKKSERTREDIMRSVIELIEETGSTDFTISKIAERADVAVGLMNYHFASKQELIVTSVKTYVENCIQSDNVFMLSEKLVPRELLIKSFQSYADFLYNHKTISRLHIQYSLDGKISADSMSLAMTYYLPIVENINPALSKEQALMALMMISSTIQLLFLETDIAKETTDFDFSNATQRNRMIEDMVELTIG